MQQKKSACCAAVAVAITLVLACSAAFASLVRWPMPACLSTDLHVEQLADPCAGLQAAKDTCCGSGQWPCPGTEHCGLANDTSSCTSQLTQLLIGCQTAQQDQSIVSAAQTCVGTTAGIGSCSLSAAHSTCCPGGWGSGGCSGSALHCGEPTSQSSCTSLLLLASTSCATGQDAEALQADQPNIQNVITQCAAQALSGGGGGSPSPPSCTSQALTQAKSSCCPSGWGTQCAANLNCGAATTGCASQLTTALQPEPSCAIADQFVQTALSTCECCHRRALGGWVHGLVCVVR